MFLISLICPGLTFLLDGKIISAIFAVIFQIIAILTFLLFGVGIVIWIILVIWATSSHSKYKTDKKIKQALNLNRQ